MCTTSNVGDGTPESFYEGDSHELSDAGADWSAALCVIARPNTAGAWLSTLERCSTEATPKRSAASSVNRNQHVQTQAWAQTLAREGA